jgi:hypothetical protein
MSRSAKQCSIRFTGANTYPILFFMEVPPAHNVDPLTVAMQTGTSVARIEKAYHKFIPSALQEKLASLRE